MAFHAQLGAVCGFATRCPWNQEEACTVNPGTYSRTSIAENLRRKSTRWTQFDDPKLHTPHLDVIGGIGRTR